MKTQIREIINVDHDFPSSGQAADNGQHKQVTLQEQANLGTGAAGATILGNQTVNSKGELVYTDEDDNDIQLTDAGSFGSTNSNGKVDTLVVNTAITYAGTNLFDMIYPIGIVVTLGVSTNPNSLFGRGTWTAITGKVIVGIAGSGTFDTLDATGGSETSTIAEANLPTSLTVTVAARTSDQGGVGSAGIFGVENAANGTIADVALTSVGSGTALDVMDPYIVKYVWQRTA